MTRHVLPKEVTVPVPESRAAPVAAVSLVVAAGSACEMPATAGISHSVQRAMVRGTMRRPMKQFAEAAEALGAVDAAAGVEHAEHQGRALARRDRDRPTTVVLVSR